MAIVKFIPSLKSQTPGGMNGIMKYICQMKKTMHEGRTLISGVNCLPRTACREFLNTKQLYQKTGGRMFYHMIQSFSPEDQITPETAHAIALDMAKEFPGFEILIATHCDAEHIHSHFLINSVSCETGKKYHSNLESLRALRDASDELCRKYGLSVIQPKQKRKEHTMSGREYRAYEKGQSWKMDLEINIDECMTMAKDREHFAKLMEWNGYSVRWTADRKYITYTTPEGYRCRDSRLNGRKYHKEVMEYEFQLRAEICRRYERAAEADACQSGSGTPHRDGDGTELAGLDRFPEGTGQSLGADPSDPRYPGNDGTADGVSELAAGHPEGGGPAECGAGGAVPPDLSRADGTDHGAPDETLWERERGIFEVLIAGEIEDDRAYEAQFSSGTAAQPAVPSFAVDAAYLAADLSNLIEDTPVEDCTTKHFRPERKNHGPAM